ncbi:MAG: RNA polymerase sigma factor [Marinilabiliales bacterium]|nr:RNA polymerase sigma factor [Marinilabiliales bacterium]
MMEKSSDERLMKQLAAGEMKAASLLYDRHHRHVYNYFVRMTRDSDASRDLTQNVFLKVIRYANSWRDDKVFLPWLFRIARNIMVDHFRGAQRFYQLEDEPEIILRDKEDAVRSSELNEAVGFLMEAMAKLPPGYRELIELNRFQGFSYKEIALTTDSSENTVRVRTFRAIQKLKEIYAQMIVD